ncbi:MAG: leucine-rich repeat protein [Clostridia bacterium]|nr:leucine-rich repeat protein [Clostridia bacterium]
MRRSLIPVLAALLVLLAAAGAGGEPADGSPLVGLWEFEKTGAAVGMDFMSYAEYTEDGTYIFQHVTGGEVRDVNICGYTDRDGSIAYDDNTWYTFTYSVEGDTLTVTRLSASRYEEDSVTTWHRLTDRPPEIMTIRRSGDFFYMPDGGDAMLVKYGGSNDPADTLTVPESLDGCRVTSLRASVFEGCRKDTVILPDTVTAIPDSAFRRSDVRRIVIPDSVTEIGAYAFAESSLTGIDLPQGLLRIGPHAFEDSALMLIDLPDSLAVIEGNPFGSCENLERIRVGDGNPAFCLRDGALYSLEDQRLIWYPAGRLDEYFTVPDGIRTVGEGAFADNRHLKAVLLPGTVTEIGAFAFEGCTHLESVEFSDSVQAIGEYAFSGCWCLKKITVPDGITELADGVFHGAAELKSVHLPDTLTRIGSGAFYGCDSLTGVVIPDGVTEIGSMAFYCCYGLTEVTLPAGLEAIQGLAFYQCSGLTDLVIPAGVNRITASAFDGCEKLTLTVTPGTWAERFCREQGLRYRCAE